MGGRHAKEMEKLLASFGVWGELGKASPLEMKNMEPPSSLLGGQAPLYTSIWFSW